MRSFSELNVKFFLPAHHQRNTVQLLSCGILSKRQSFCVTFLCAYCIDVVIRNLSNLFFYFSLVRFTHKINSRMLSLSNLWEYLYFFYFPTFFVVCKIRRELKWMMILKHANEVLWSLLAFSNFFNIIFSKNWNFHDKK